MLFAATELAVDLRYRIFLPTSFADVGVVVIGRNEGRRLVDCLASIRTATDNIVYVDSGSTDDSVAAATQIGATVVKLDVSQQFTAARARNEGFSALKSLKLNVRFVQFIDGDCILVSSWMGRAIDFIEQREDVAIVCGRRRERYPSASIYNQLCDLEWDTPVGEAAACGGDALVRVRAFEEAGGFHPRVMAGEEPELCIRLREQGWKIWRLDAEMTGIQLLQQLKPTDFRGKIIVLSGYLSLELEEQYRLLGADIILRKPFELHELRQAVEALRK